MIRRFLTSLFVLLVVATCGNGQTWLLHAHEEHAWHAHAIESSGGLGPGRGNSMPGDDHEHDEPLPLESADDTILVVLRSEPAISGSASPDVQLAIGSSGTSAGPISTALTPSLTSDTQLWQQQCAHATALRALDTILRSNHALLI
jgi:hypothetical protein